MSGPIGASSWMYGIEPDFYDYKINQSLRFDRASSTNLTRTAGSPSDGKKATWSWWMKKSDVVSDTSASYRTIFYSGSPNSDGFAIAFMRYGGYHYHELIVKQDNGSSAAHMFLYTDAFYRDVSSWYHFVVRYDSTDSTANDRIKIYVNGTEQTINRTGTNTEPPLNHIPSFQVSGKTLRIGEGRTDDDEHIGGYLAEVNFIDGTAYDASNFGETKDGVWVAKDSSGLTFGNNGFYLPFDDSSAIGDDKSSNTNDFTANNFSAHDVVPDSPTNNFAVMSSIHPSSSNFTISDGNLSLSKSGTGNFGLYSQSLMPTTGKWYFEACITGRGSSDRTRVGVANYNSVTGTSTIQSSYSGVEIATSTLNRVLITAGGSVTEVDGFFTALSDNDIVRFAVDMDNGRLYVGVNGNWWNWQTSQTGGDPTSGSGYVTNSTTIFDGSPMTAYSGFSAGLTTSTGQTFNFGQDSTFAGAISAGGNKDDNGVGDFAYAPPSDYLALCTANFPTPTILDGSEYFNTVLYTGNGSTQSITGVGFSPDWVWGKERPNAESHWLFDSIRGATKQISSNSTNAESTQATMLTSFDSDGFTMGSDGAGNQSSTTYVAWNWKAGGAAVSNTDGSITSQVSANPTAGFSIVGYTGTGSGGATVGHGLGTVPDFLIIRRRDPAEAWPVWVGGGGFSNTQYLRLNATNAVDTATTLFNSTTPTSSVVTLGSGDFVNTSTKNYIMYAFHSVESYSKVGSYTGNGSADGTFVYTGFRPAWILFKNTSTTTNWEIYDTTRQPSNVALGPLYANLNSAEESHATLPALDILSNGFKPRSTWAEFNTSGHSYIYLAFAEQPFKFANAR